MRIRINSCPSLYGLTIMWLKFVVMLTDVVINANICNVIQVKCIIYSWSDWNRKFARLKDDKIQSPARRNTIFTFGFIVNQTPPHWLFIIVYKANAYYRVYTLFCTVPRSHNWRTNRLSRYSSPCQCCTAWASWAWNSHLRLRPKLHSKPRTK
jgi:hypothetical protein